MAIRLDWELESEAGWSEVGEDPAALDARRRRNRQVRNLVILLLSIGLIAAGVIGWRLRIAARQLQENLQTTVAAETTALRIGDLEGFLRAQADVGQWQRLQRAAFDDYRAYGERIAVTGEIVSLDITANRARVVLKETLDGEIYHVQWFYEHTEGDWRHIPPNPEFWGDVVVESTQHFEFQYRDADQALAEALKDRTAEWWQTFCKLTACLHHPPLEVTIRIEPDPLMEFGWAPYDDRTLLIPSPQLDRMPPDGSMDPALFDRVATMLARRWAYHAVASRMAEVDPGPTPDITWFRDELAGWLTYRLTESGSPPEFLTPLSEAYGDEMVIRLLVDLPAVAQQGSFVPSLEAVTGESALDLPVGWNGYLTHRLRAEASMIADGYDTEAALIYRDAPGDRLVAADVPTETIADAHSITVIGTHRAGDLLWAEVRFTPASSGDEPAQQVISYEPFRLVDGRWVHTWAAQTDWGAYAHSETGDHIHLTYFDLDAPNVEGLLPALDQVARQAMADFGMDPLEIGPISVIVSPEDSYAISSSIAVWVRSPNASIRSADISPQEYVYHSAAGQIVEQLLGRQLGTFPANHPLAVAFLTREAELTGLDAVGVQASYLKRYGRVGPMWPAGGGDGWLTFHTPYEDADYEDARLLLDVLEQRYGPQVIPVLLNYLPIAVDMDDWLQRSVGIGLQDIQADWQTAAGD